MGMPNFLTERGNKKATPKYPAYSLFTFKKRSTLWYGVMITQGLEIWVNSFAALLQVMQNTIINNN